MTQQRKITWWGSDIRRAHEKERRDEIDTLLSDGWKVVNMCPFSQNVSISLGSSLAHGIGVSKSDYTAYGEYGIVYILEKEFPEEKEDAK